MAAKAVSNMCASNQKTPAHPDLTALRFSFAKLLVGIYSKSQVQEGDVIVHTLKVLATIGDVDLLSVVLTRANLIWFTVPVRTALVSYVTLHIILSFHLCTIYPNVCIIRLIAKFGWTRCFPHLIPLFHEVKLAKAMSFLCAVWPNPPPTLLPDGSFDGDRSQRAVHLRALMPLVIAKPITASDPKDSLLQLFKVLTTPSFVLFILIQYLACSSCRGGRGVAQSKL